MSRYPEAIPIKTFNPKAIVRELISCFTLFGLPKIVQSDNGTSFTSKRFQEEMDKLGIKHITSTPYHPESQGVVKLFHQTIKEMLKKCCQENVSNWNEFIPYLIFAIMSTPNESRGISPFQMVFGHMVHGPLKLLKEG